MQSKSNLNKGYDHHVFTGLIKTYLRELPSPLLGEELYPDWLEAGSLGGEDRFNAIWNLLQSDYLPRENYKNIQYLFRYRKKMLKDLVGIFLLKSLLKSDKFHYKLQRNKEI